LCYDWKRLVFTELELSRLAHRKLIIGTRGSALALAQTNGVAQQLIAHHPSLMVETRIIRTQGDKNQTAPFAQIGGKGIFTKDIEQALLDETVDVAVHSMKDLPNELPEGLIVAAVPEREDAHDALIVRKGLGLKVEGSDASPFLFLRADAIVGTSSVRRRAQLLRQRPDLRIVELRGNVDTRLRKLESQGLDAIVLAAAGLRRLGFIGSNSGDPSGLSHVASFVFLPFGICLPDPGQGALAIECRAHDGETSALLQPLNHPETLTATLAERAFVRAVEGSCRVPIGALAEIENGQVHLRALIASPDGSQCVRDDITGSATDAEALGRELGEKLLRSGGTQILANVN
jgi:hydroxymethylbilane synthase